ncbi:MAG: flagellar filament capping protein FliD [Acidobacteria bacterium]|nr:flagellar filament capping protein FliD [Acidobacteriota bacterium]
MSSIGITVPTFNGSSKYSSDFQQVLTRAVSIASLPLQQMQNQQNKLSSEQSALQGLQSAFSSLQDAISTIAAASKGSTQASVSDSTVVTAHTDASALDGTYGIQVTDLGGATTTVSKGGLITVTDASSGNISGSSSFTLTINGTSHTLTPGGNSLQDLASSINGASLGVQATIINAGSTSSPDYRLSITSNHYAADTIQLNDGSSDLLDTLSTGSAVTYQVNGLAGTLQSDSRTVTLAPGLTVDLLKAAPGQQVTIQVSHNYSALQNSLNGLVSTYNQASQALGQQRGQNSGPLAGQSIIFELEQSLRDLTQYTGTSGNIGSITDLGLNIDKNGVLTFDSSVFSSLSPSDIQGFLGDTTTMGFLKSATDGLNMVADSTSGAIEDSLQSINSQISRSQDQISTEQDRINNMATTLQQQLANADAAIAVLEGQVTYMTNLFQTLFLNNNNTNNKNN